jgi:hypothetical protein
MEKHDEFADFLVSDEFGNIYKRTGRVDIES